MTISLEKLKSLATIKFEAIQEDFPLSEDFDPEVAEALNAEILEKYDYFPNPLWFCAKVTAAFAGITSDPEYLGGCSYNSYEDFTSEVGGYYEEMVLMSLKNLMDQLTAVQQELKKIEE